MRSILVATALALLLTTTAHAQTSPAAPIQLPVAVRILKDGAAVTDTLALRFSIYDDPTAGSELWNEPATNVAVQGGFASHTLGLSGQAPLPAAIFNGRVLYLQVVVAGFVMDQRIALRSVPYALRAGTAGVADKATLADRATLAESLGLPTTAAADRVTVNAQGRVGLGVAPSATDRLNVNGTIRASGITVENGGVVADPTIGIALRTTVFTTASPTFVDVPGLTTTLTTHGKPVLISVNTNFNARIGPTGANDVWAVLTIYRDGQDLNRATDAGFQIAQHDVGYNTPMSFTFVDTPAAGQHTYKLMARSGNGGTFDLSEGSQVQQIAVIELN